jgi:hypothetical protein
MKRLYFSRFLPTWDLGGGSRRLMQVLDVLKPLGCQLRSGPANGTRQRRARTFALLADRGLRRWAPQRRQAVLRLRGVSRDWSRDPGDIDGLDLAFMDDPIYFLPLFETLQRRRVPVIAVCHNLESLVSGQAAPGASWALLRQELNVLSCCRLAVTISREESWLLDNLGIANVFFPYYPLAPVLERLLTVRGRRRRCAGAEPGGVLLLANAWNPPSVAGARQAIMAWRAQGLAAAFGPLLLAGFKSEQAFAGEGLAPDVRLLGTLENSRLDELLAEVSACLCYQESGGGALTRIAEMLIAGVPVLANTHAARSHYGVPGLVEFRGLDSLGEALQRLRATAREFPPPLPPDASVLFAAIDRAGGGGA